MIQNKNLNLYVALFLPSAMGVVLYTFASILILFLKQFDFIQQYLQIPDNVNFMSIFLTWLDHTVNRILGETRTEAVVVGLFWAVVGLGVYAFLRGIAGFINNLEEGVEERRYLWPRGTSRNEALREAFEGIVLRVFAFIALLIAIFWPLARLLKGPVGGYGGALKYVIWFVLLWLVLHVCVILLRLVALRPRLFN